MIRLLVALAIACSSGATLAQKKMYRCGNQFQERPCEGPKPGATGTSADKPDSQLRQDTETQHRERERAIHQAQCENYAEELADIERRIRIGADREVMDQFMRRQKEMRIRIQSRCS